MDKNVCGIGVKLSAQHGRDDCSGNDCSGKFREFAANHLPGFSCVLKHSTSLHGQNVQRHLQLRDRRAQFRMRSDLLLQGLQNLVSTRNMSRCLGGFPRDWVRFAFPWPFASFVLPQFYTAFRSHSNRYIASPALGAVISPRVANRSDQRILPVTCITTNRVTIAMIVIASPVNPFQKNAYENNTR